MKSNADFTLITGASSGIGYELAKVFAREQHNLILSARSTDKLEQLKKQLQAQYKVQIEIITLDLSEAGSAQKLFEKVDTLGLAVDILVNNAGVGTHGNFADIDLQKTKSMIHLNIVSLTELTKLFLPAMLAKKSGRILNVASVAGFQPGPLMSVYYATKAYVLFFSEGLFEEVKNLGVTVTALCPGPTASGFQANANMENMAIFDNLKVPTSATVAEYGYRAMIAGKAVAVEGFANKLFPFIVRLFPRFMVRQVVMKVQQKRLA